jgi:hypothetical protein
MNTRNQGLIERWGPRRAKQVVLTLALLSLMLIVTASALLVFDALRSQREVQAAAIAVLALMALLLWMRVVRSRWALLQVQSFEPSPANEETGVWGVGGPGMRIPGATGIFGPTIANRRQSEHDRREDHQPR